MACQLTQKYHIKIPTSSAFAIPHSTTSTVSSCSKMLLFHCVRRNREKNSINTEIAAGIFQSRNYTELELVCYILLYQWVLSPIIYDFVVDRQISCATFWKFYKSASAFDLVRHSLLAFASTITSAEQNIEWIHNAKWRNIEKKNRKQIIKNVLPRI